MEGQGRDPLPFHIPSLSPASGSYSWQGRQTPTSEETSSAFPRSSGQKFYNTGEVALVMFLGGRNRWNRRLSSNPNLVLIKLVT